MLRVREVRIAIEVNLSVGTLIVSVGILIGSVGILIGSVGILIGSVGILIHWYFKRWYFEF